MHPAPDFEKIKVRTNIYQRKGAEVLLKTILNRVQKYKGFIYESLAWRDPINNCISIGML